MFNLESLRNSLYSIPTKISNGAYEIKRRIVYDPRISMGTGLTMIAYNIEEWVNNLALNRSLFQYVNSISKEYPHLAAGIGFFELLVLGTTALPVIFGVGMLLSLRGYELRKMLNKDFRGDFDEFVSQKEYEKSSSINNPFFIPKPENNDSIP